MSGDNTTKANTAEANTAGTPIPSRKKVIADLTSLGYFLQKADPAKEYYDYVNFELWEVYSSKSGVGIDEPIDKMYVIQWTTPQAAWLRISRKRVLD